MDILNIGNDELCDNDVDIYCDNKPYNVIVEDTFEDAKDNLNWAKNDVDGITINTPIPSYTKNRGWKNIFQKA